MPKSRRENEIVYGVIASKALEKQALITFQWFVNRTLLILHIAQGLQHSSERAMDVDRTIVVLRLAFWHPSKCMDFA
jgi:hypothetical protein